MPPASWRDWRKKNFPMKTQRWRIWSDDHRRPGAWRAAFVLYAIACMAQAAVMCSGAPPPTGSSGGLAAPPLSNGPVTPETEALLKHLASLADSQSNQAQSELAKQLADVATLDRLDEPKERNQRTPQDLRVARVFDHLRDNPSHAAANTLSALSRSEVFNSDWRLQALVIRALGTQRPLLAESAAFLDAQSQSNSLNLQNVIITLIENESAPAAALLGRKLEDSNLDDNNKISWIRYQLLPKRRSAQLLYGVEKWLAAGKLDETVRIALVDALFDYRPREWGGTDLPAPPSESSTSAEAAKVVRRIAELVLASNYPSSVRDSVRQTLTRLP